MIENNFQNDRKEILRLITIGVCLLELLIAVCTFFYQQDTQSRTEIPISEEMARVYIEHPEKLKENERLSVTTHPANQRGYILITHEIVRRAFPWKGWILLSIGVPVTLAFLIVLVAKAYCQVAELEENESGNTENRWIRGINSLSKINIAWFMLVMIGAVLLVWYVPEFLKIAGNASSDWLARFWWIPVMICVLAFLITALWFVLQYRLKLQALQMKMEFEKLKFLQGAESKEAPAIENARSHSPAMIENHLKKEQQ